MNGSVTVIAHCADYAHSTSGMNITCTSDGSWSGTSPVCQCIDGYRLIITENTKQLCEDIKSFSVRLLKCVSCDNINLLTIVW